MMKMRTWMRAAVTVAVFGGLLLLLPWSDLAEAANRITWQVWIGSLAGFLIGHRLGVVKWRALINVGRGRLPTNDAVAIYGAGLFANLCLPSVVGGDIVRVGLAGRRTGRPEAALFGSIADRLIDIGVTGGLIVIGGLLAHDTLQGWTADAAAVFLLVFGAAGMGAIVAVTRRPLASWPRRFRRPIGRSLVAVRYLSRSPVVAALAVVISVAMQSGFVLLNAWIGRSIGIDVPLAVWFFVWPLAKVAGLVPISLGGLAVRDATLAALLLPAGVTASLGVVAALVWQSVMIAGGLVGGIVFWAYRARRAGIPSLFRLRLPAVAGSTTDA